MYVCQPLGEGLDQLKITVGKFQYDVDLRALTQTNLSTKKVRQIRSLPVDPPPPVIADLPESPEDAVPVD